jgi:hypothetical protein
LPAKNVNNNALTLKVSSALRFSLASQLLQERVNRESLRAKTRSLGYPTTPGSNGNSRLAIKPPSG